MSKQVTITASEIQRACEFVLVQLEYVFELAIDAAISDSKPKDDANFQRCFKRCIPHILRDIEEDFTDFHPSSRSAHAFVRNALISPASVSRARRGRKAVA